MLLKLTVKNIVLIPYADVEFLDGLNVLTGETGAGKSIIVDCLMLLYGARYDKSLLRFGADEGFVEGVFTIGNDSVQILQEIGLEREEVAIIKRRFTSEGRSEIKINGQTCTVSMLKKLMLSLVDIYGQHDFQRLFEKGHQLALLDYYDRQKQSVLKENLLNKYNIYSEVIKELKSLGNESERAKEIDFINYQIAEIENSSIYKTEEDELVDKRRRALNAETIQNALSESSQILNELSLNDVVILLSKIAEYDERITDYISRIQSAAIELDDINHSLKSDLNDYFKTDTDIDKIEDRIHFIRAIGRKYGKFDEMQVFLDKSHSRLNLLENSEQIYEKLTQKKKTLIKEIFDLSQALSLSRQNTAGTFCEKISKELHDLGMENAQFSIKFNEFPSISNCEKFISSNGMDQVEFYLKTNAGQPFLPLLKIVSGGEMSRFMLAIKVVSGDADQIPTLIFDEIDSGISGRTGQEVAKKLAQLSSVTQVICVTHLPQIAAMGEKHIYVKKQLGANDTVTIVENLDRQGMINEISRLSGGVGISGSSQQNAEEIKRWSDEFKQSILNH